MEKTSFIRLALGLDSITDGKIELKDGESTVNPENIGVVLDEPTIGLDPVSWKLVKESVKRNRREQNGCVVITGQDYFEMRSFADKILILDEGKCRYKEEISLRVSYFTR